MPVNRQNYIYIALALFLGTNVLADSGDGQLSYCKPPSELYMRQGTGLAHAPHGALEAAQRYCDSPVKGPLIKGVRLTILADKNKCRVNDEVRIVHIFDAVEPGRSVDMMGPAEIFGEFVDGKPSTPERGEPPTFIEGVVLKSPVVNFNYDVSAYRFSEPGIHNIRWTNGGSAESNILRIEVVK